jgi:quercetin dioxygenase-like cupin family protein
MKAAVQAMTQTAIEVVDLLEIGRGLAPDNDHSITGKVEGSVAIIRLEKGIEYPLEEHNWTETVTDIEGAFAIIADGSHYSVNRGSCIRIPPGVKHRWDPLSEAIVLVTFSDPMRA